MVYLVTVTYLCVCERERRVEERLAEGGGGGESTCFAFVMLSVCEGIEKSRCCVLLFIFIDQRHNDKSDRMLKCTSAKKERRRRRKRKRE